MGKEEEPSFLLIDDLLFAEVITDTFVKVGECHFFHIIWRESEPFCTPTEENPLAPFPRLAA